MATIKQEPIKPTESSSKTPIKPHEVVKQDPHQAPRSPHLKTGRIGKGPDMRFREWLRPVAIDLLHPMIP
jgi:hypothetical protein